MLRYPANTLRAAAIAISALLATTAAVPASAQVSVSIGFDNFHSRLAPYGTWSNHPRWGEVWQPGVRANFRPYYNGHWADTNEYGYMWVSNDPWGDIPYHYGRWVFEPGDGWFWVPGYVWGPSWVVWRSGGGNIGWFPMPPGDNYYGNGAYRDNFDNQYGYRDWYGPSFDNNQFLSLWVFVGLDHFRDQNYRNYALQQRDYGRFIGQTTNTTNYVTINNYVVNRSIDGSRFANDSNQRYAPVAASSVIRNAQVTQVDVGRQVEQRERVRHPIPVNINPAEPRGRGDFKSNAQQPNQNRAQQGPGNREPGSVVVDPSARTAPGPAPDASKQNDRGQANINPNEQRGRGNPNSNAQQPNATQAPQNLGSRGGERGSNGKGAEQSNVQPERNAPNAPVAITPPQNAAPQNPAASQGRAEQRNRGAGGPAAAADPGANGNARANPPGERASPVFQPPPNRGAAEQNGKAVVQDARPPARAQRDAPAAAAPDTARNNQARGNRPDDSKNADDQKAPDEKKNGANRGRN